MYLVIPIFGSQNDSSLICVEYKTFGSITFVYIKYSLLCDLDMILFTLKSKGKKIFLFEDKRLKSFSFDLIG